MLGAENVVEILVASRHFNLDALLDACLEHISISLDEENVWSLLFMADMYELPELKVRTKPILKLMCTFRLPP